MDIKTNEMSSIGVNMIKLLKKDLIKIGSTSINKSELLEEISVLVGTKCKKISKNEILKALIKREQLSSTGVGGSIAIPHCTFDNLTEFYIGIIITNEIDFDSIDGEPVRVTFFSVGPTSQKNQHISTLTSISKISMNKELLQKIIKSDNSNDIYNMLYQEEDIRSANTEKCQIVIHVQDEKIFNDILEVLASDVDGAISVIDAQTAGYYLHKTPLFSSFWNDISDSFSKMIISVIDKKLVNETIRKINITKRENNSGLLVTVNDLLYFDGSLEY